MIDPLRPVPLPNTPFIRAELKNKRGSGYKIKSAQVRGHDGASTPVYQFAPPPVGSYTNNFYPLGPLPDNGVGGASDAMAAWTDSNDVCQATRTVEYEFVVEKADGTNDKTYSFTASSGANCAGGVCRLRLTRATFQGVNEIGRAHV